MLSIARFCAVASVMRINHFRYNGRGHFVLAVVYLKRSKVLRCRKQIQRKRTWAKIGANGLKKYWLCGRRVIEVRCRQQQQSRSKTAIVSLSLPRSKKTYLPVLHKKLFLRQFEESEEGFALSPCSMSVAVDLSRVFWTSSQERTLVWGSR